MGRYARNSIGQYAPVGAAADDLPGGATPTGKKTIDTTAEVDVASYATAQVVDENLAAENIKKDVSVLGITGAYEGVSYSTLPAPVMTATLVCEDYADVSLIESFLYDDNNDEIYYTEMTANTLTITGKICPYLVYDQYTLEWAWYPIVTWEDSQTQQLIPFDLAYSNCVNCVVDETQDNAVAITDPTLPCSCTITCTKSST